MRAGAGAGSTERTHVRGRCSPDSAAVANTAELGHAQHRGMCPEEGRGSSKCRGLHHVRTGDSPTGLEDSRTGDRGRISIETLAGTPEVAPSSLGPVSAPSWNRGAVRVAQAVGTAPRGYPHALQGSPLADGDRCCGPREKATGRHTHTPGPQECNTAHASCLPLLSLWPFVKAATENTKLCPTASGK